MRAAALLLSSSLLAACGERTALDLDGTPDGGAAPTPAGRGDLTCRPFDRCGGDAVGRWTVRATCGGGADVPNCAGGKFDVSGVRMEGTIDLRADMTYTSSTTTRGTMGMLMPKSCLAMLGVPVQCAALGPLLTLGLAMDPMSPITAARCSEVGTACDCKLELRATPQSEAGSWRSEGGTLVTRAQGGADERLGYCVDGGVMRVSTVAAGLGGMGSPALTLVLQR